MSRRARRGIAPALALCLGGCTGVQSILAPGGRNAGEIATLWWYMFGVGMAILALVAALYAYALFSDPQRRVRPAPELVVATGGMALPIVCFSILLPMTFRVSRLATADVPPNTLRVEVQAHQFWWEFRYDVPNAPWRSFYIANEIHLPAGKPVEFIVTSADVTHSFWVPGLAGKVQVIPGLRNRLVIEGDRPGVYRGECALLCGLSHAKMAFYAVVEPPATFDAWMAHQLAPATPPAEGPARAGYLAFRTHGCVFCHAARGLGAWGRRAPDLTHVGSRLSIAAGTFTTSPAAFAAWIADNQHIKPDNHMLSFAALDAPTLQALASFLESLK